MPKTFCRGTKPSKNDDLETASSERKFRRELYANEPATSCIETASYRTRLSLSDNVADVYLTL
jgi:hypothetical protein